MTKIFVFLTDSLSETDFENIEKALKNSSFSESVQEVLSKKHEQKKRESILVRALLYSAYTAQCGNPPPPLKKTRSGAPFLKGSTRISLSHTRGAVAVLLSNERRYGFGVDIEGGAVALPRAERIESRFLKGLRDGPAFSDAELFLATLADADALSFQFSSLLKGVPTDGFLARFTRAEAILKSTGRGFENASRLSRLSSFAKTETVGIVNERGDSFVLSYAKRSLFFSFENNSEVIPWQKNI